MRSFYKKNYKSTLPNIHRIKNGSTFLLNLDLDTFDKFNRELVGDVVNEKDGIIFQQVEVYKISVKDTRTNIYGETVGGKFIGLVSR